MVDRNQVRCTDRLFSVSSHLHSLVVHLRCIGVEAKKENFDKGPLYKVLVRLPGKTVEVSLIASRPSPTGRTQSLSNRGLMVSKYLPTKPLDLCMEIFVILLI